MPSLTIFEPRYPQPARTVAEQLHIDVCRLYVWRLLVAPQDPIIRERMMFGIQLPGYPQIVYAQLGAVVMRDLAHIVFALVTNHPGSPPLILVALTNDDDSYDVTWLTWLVPIHNSNSGIMFAYRG